MVETQPSPRVAAMNDPIDSAMAGNRRDLAAYWFTRQQSGNMSAAEHRQFAAWQNR